MKLLAPSPSFELRLTVSNEMFDELEEEETYTDVNQKMRILNLFLLISSLRLKTLLKINDSLLKICR